jgi:UDP-N-acetylmuramate dehydrogenase
MTKKVDFSKYSSIKIGPVCEVTIINDPDEESDELTIIGGANNLLISNNPPRLAKLSKNFDYILVKNKLLHIGGATPGGKVLSYCKKNNIKGFELLQKLPGLMGGIVKMNAGLKEYEIFNNLVRIKTKKGYLDKDTIEYGYRKTDIKGIIYEAVFKLEEGFDNDLFDWFEKLRLNQPLLPSAGSCFKNPKSDYAGRILEECGLKGFRIKGVGFSKKHANFLVNYGNGTFEDAVSLINLAKKRVYEKFGIDLELEIIII